MADGQRRTEGERDRDNSFINLLNGIFKSLEKIGSEISKLSDNMGCNCNCKCKSKK
jgi:hypothetical protein